MESRTLSTFLRRIRKVCKGWATPAVTQVSRAGSPFRVLVSCILSLRTRDEVTEAASARLFKIADTPVKLVKFSEAQLEKAIYPAAFFRNKSKSLLKLSEILIEEYKGQVPDSMEGLLALPGVGRKTANLTLVLGFDKMGICVDTHVHRICNRWGLVTTKSPDETEMALRECLPKRNWKEFNDLLVTFGQNCCQPVSPWCSQCVVAELCPKNNVTKSR